MKSRIILDRIISHAKIKYASQKVVITSESLAQSLVKINYSQVNCKNLGSGQNFDMKI